MDKQQDILITVSGLETYLICPRAWHHTEGQGHPVTDQYTQAQEIIAGRKKLSERLALGGAGSIVLGTLIFVISFVVG